ncbi:DotU family type IV/VI secretion system protein [Corallococcus sp. AB030]|uniref:DotU family type IV/VI secretion system protein n=1 Tax=Corallococcus sp. AB030 TaxID=2316716 RepID=UPI000EBABAD1|nr:DotU family type IV/VI secretion system protein [Corallococcus sp. AB030]RKH95147.1 DotU family type IV/VI secretion system protein [Corallococcus sp. AB030]
MSSSLPTEYQPHRAPLLEQAREFLSELLRLKQTLAEAPAPDPDSDEPAPEDDPFARVRTAMVEKLERLGSHRSRGKEDAQEIRPEEVRYVLAAFTDEVLIQHAWPGRDAWSSALLEEELFGTHVAGDQLFTDIEALLREADAARVEMAAVYLLVLSLGFQGRFRDRDAGTQLRKLRRRLFAFVFRREPGSREPAHRLLPQAYAHTLDGKHERRLASLRPWACALAAVVGLGVVAGNVIVRRETRGLRASLDRILAHGEVPR